MPKENALVSIVVPVYGTEDYLPACIESLSKQTYSNIEIILIDDQSPDNCPQICDQYAQRDPRITVIHQKNKGVSGARNTGISHSNGEYIMFVDSDDELYNNAVKVLVDDIQMYKADIVSASVKSNQLNGSIFSECEDGTYTFFKDDDLLLLSLQGDRKTISACGKLFRAELLHDISFEEGKHINEDGFFMFLCFLKQPILIHHNVSVYQCNARADSSSRQTFSDKYLAMLYFCERKKQLIAVHYPEYIEQTYNMEIHTNLQLLDILCSTTDEKRKELQKRCVNTVCRLYQYHKPINKHYEMLAWIVAHGMYPLYKWAVRLKYYR